MIARAPGWLRLPTLPVLRVLPVLLVLFLRIAGPARAVSAPPPARAGSVPDEACALLPPPRPPGPSGVSPALLREAQKHVDAAAAAYTRKRDVDALRELRAAYERVPDADVLFNIAQACREAGHDRSALRLYEAVLVGATDPELRADTARHVEALRITLARALDDSARALRANHDLAGAVAAWTDAFSLKTDARFLFEIAETQRQGGRLPEAVEAYRRFLAASPINNDSDGERRAEAEQQVARIRGLLLDQGSQAALAAGRNDEAITAAREAYAVDPRPSYLLARARAERAGARFDEALDSLHRYLDVAPDGAERADVQAQLSLLRAASLSQVARIAMERKQYGPAYDDWVQADRLDPSSPIRAFQAAEAARLAGRHAEALAAYRDYLSRAPDGERRAEAEQAAGGVQLSLEAKLREAELRRPRPIPLYRRWWPWTAAAFGLALAGGGIAVGVVAGTPLAPTLAQPDAPTIAVKF